MTNPSSREADQAKPVLTKANIVEVIIRYKDTGNNNLLVRFNPGNIKAGGIIWDPTLLQDFEGPGCTLNRKKADQADKFPDPEDDTLPPPPPTKHPSGNPNTKEVPAATCCYVNGRWICWD